MEIKPVQIMDSVCCWSQMGKKKRSGDEGEINQLNINTNCRRHASSFPGIKDDTRE